MIQFTTQQVVLMVSAIDELRRKLRLLEADGIVTIHSQDELDDLQAKLDAEIGRRDTRTPSLLKSTY